MVKKETDEEGIYTLRKYFYQRKESFPGRYTTIQTGYFGGKVRIGRYSNPVSDRSGTISRPSKQTRFRVETDVEI